MTIVMQPLCLRLTSLLLLASPAAHPVDAPSGRHDVLEQYNRLDPAGQQQWVRDLLVRLDRANRLVLTRGEAAAEQARGAVLLRQMAEVRTIPHSELLELLRQTDQREKAAIERLARRFRIRVYNTFRLRRDEFSRRRAAWNRALAFWEAAGSTPQQQSRLIDWLEAAIGSSTPGSVAPLPDVPIFEPPPVAEQSAARGVASLGAGIGPRNPVGAASSMSPQRAAGVLPGIDRQPVAGLPPSDRPLPLVLPPAAVQRSTATDQTATTATRANQPPSRSVDKPAPLLPKPDKVPSAASQAARPSPKRSPAWPPHRVNLAELATRIAGANLALQTLQAELDADSRWDARRLRPLVDRLALLLPRHNDLALFRQLISPGEREQVGRLQSPQTAISRLAARIFEARTYPGGPGFIGTEAQRRAKLRELDELSRRLAEIASQK